MLSQHCLKKLVEYLVKLNENQKLIESLKQTFGRNSYFQVQTAFARFDKFSKGFLSPSDFSEFMLENGIYPTEDELYLVFRDFDKGLQGVVTIDLFEEEMLPRENAQLRKEIVHRKFYAPNIRLEEDLEFQIGKYFQAKLDGFLALNAIRIELFKDPHFTTSKAFLLLQNKGKGIIETKQDIDSFLRKNGKALRAEQLRRVYESLAFRRPGPTTLERFDDHLDPLGKGYYAAYELRLKERLEMKNIQVVNQESRRLLQEERVRNEIEQERLARNYVALKDSNQTVRRVIENQYLEKEVEREILYDKVRRSREIMLEEEARLSRLKASDYILQREFLRPPYPYY